MRSQLALVDVTGMISTEVIGSHWKNVVDRRDPMRDVRLLNTFRGVCRV